MHFLYIILFLCLDVPVVNVGDYIQAVLDRNLAENISRVLYPNDNVSFPRIDGCIDEEKRRNRGVMKTRCVVRVCECVFARPHWQLV